MSTDLPLCDLCGNRHALGGRCPAIDSEVSVPADRIDEHYKDQIPERELDEMVTRASVPNLAALFKKAKEAGVIQPAKEYGDGA